MRDEDSASKGDTSSSIYIPSDRLKRVHQVHNQVQRLPDRTALWRTIELGLDELEKDLETDGE